MKLSSDPASPDHWSYHIPYDRPFEVRLDNIKVKYATELDTVEGWVEYFVTDADDNVREDPNKPGSALIGRSNGRVEVIPLDKNKIVRSISPYGFRYLNGIRLEFETELLLTADIPFLMRRQRNKGRFSIATEAMALAVKREPVLRTDLS